ncbi:hypothetical protein G352_10877 [Rhodococcus ruber BKS 20-38]|uniref:Uncharacterized protein n=1 Tax=Rhodococcus ruber BKS 20-38 TaxID=1278076 RepID=M2ZWB3_9NOCA|nr:hypothetical protein [Rhodococcus ruber]EME65038.1 hypothetical protein G352_10877 [Rhodococcus ruber BKS 20-38]
MRLQAQELNFSHLGKMLVADGGHGAMLKAPITALHFTRPLGGPSRVTVSVHVLEEFLQIELEPSMYVQIAESLPS